MYTFDAKETKNKIVEWIKMFFEQNGKDCIATVGLSGGKDSSIVAALCVEALGKNRVLGVLMPDGEQTDIEDAYEVAKHLGIEYCTVDIHPAILALKHEIRPQIGDHWSKQTSINLPPRIRMATLYAISQSMNGRVANTCNLSETLLSWETRWGDAVGDFAPLKDFTVQEVKAIGYETILLKKMVDKTPSDGLCGSSDESALGFKYSVFDRYTRTGEIDDAAVKAIIDARVEKYRFKRRPIPYFESGLKSYFD